MSKCSKKNKIYAEAQSSLARELSALYLLRKVRFLDQAVKLLLTKNKATLLKHQTKKLVLELNKPKPPPPVEKKNKVKGIDIAVTALELDSSDFSSAKASELGEVDATQKPHEPDSNTVNHYDEHEPSSIRTDAEMI